MDILEINMLGDMNIIYSVVLGYILGSVPFGLIFAFLFKLGNLRDIGSGNIGATNVLRTGNKLAALSTLLFDILKGSFAVLMAKFYLGDFYMLFAAISVFIGHIFPIWLKFKGGKGVATYLGTLYGIFPFFGILASLFWLAGAVFTRISAIGALLMSFMLPLIFWIFNFIVMQGNSQQLSALALTYTIMTVFLFLKHWGNIKRIFQKKEPIIKF